jgi:hypothetical protein
MEFGGLKSPTNKFAATQSEDCLCGPGSKLAKTDFAFCSGGFNCFSLQPTPDVSFPGNLALSISLPINSIASPDLEHLWLFGVLTGKMDYHLFVTWGL